MSCTDRSFSLDKYYIKYYHLAVNHLTYSFLGPELVVFEDLKAEK